MEKAQELLNQALTLINEQDFTQAQSILEQCIKLDENNIEIYKNLGLCEINLDNPQGAADAFSKAVEINPLDASSLFYLASAKARLGQKEDAVKYFEKVVTLRPDYIDAYKNLAMIYIEFTQIDNAIELIKKAINNPNIESDYSLYYMIATCYMLKKDYQNSLENLKKALEFNPEHIPVINSIGSCYMNMKQFDKALEALNKAYELDEKNSLTSYNIGVCYQSLGDFQTALKYFQNSYQLEPSITMLSSLANCALKAKEYELALNLYKNLVMTYPNNTQYRLCYIETLENTQNYQEALENTRMLLSVDEKNVFLQKKKGTYLRKLGLYEESIATFNTLINRGKIDVEVYYNLAFCYTEQGDFDNAKEMFKKCIILEPNNPYAHKDLGVLYLKMNCYEWAVDEMEEAIKLDNTVGEFHYSLGVAYMMLSKIDEAETSLKKAIECEPDNADALAYLGYLYMIKKDSNKAFELLQKAIEIDPQNFLAKVHLAKYYFVSKKYDIAKEFLLDVTQKTKDDETLNMLGITYLETNEYENAMGIFYKLAQKYPQNHILLTNLAKCEAKCSKTKEALEHLRQALMVFDDYKEALDLLEELNGK